MTGNPMPPAWAEALLRGVLAPESVESVSGDLLEEYRDSVHPLRGRRAANAWYVRQVLGFVSHAAQPSAMAFAGATFATGPLEWLVPFPNPDARSVVPLLICAGILLVPGYRAGSRTGSIVAGLAIGVTATAIAAPITTFLTVVLLAAWHDPATMSAVRRSGGVNHALMLPVMMVLPGLILGTLGGVVGATVRGLRRA